MGVTIFAIYLGGLISQRSLRVMELAPRCSPLRTWVFATTFDTVFVMREHRPKGRLDLKSMIKQLLHNVAYAQPDV